MNWVNSTSSKQVQKRMANRIDYLKFLAKNKDAFMSDVALVKG